MSIPDVAAALGVQIDDSLDQEHVARPPSRRRHARPETETSIRTKCASVLNQCGYCMVKHQTLHGKQGTPDLIACVRGRIIVVGRMVVIEVKRPDADPPTALQIGQLRKWQDAGALAGWVRSVEHLYEILDHLDDFEWRNTFEAPGDGRSVA